MVETTLKYRQGYEMQSFCVPNDRIASNIKAWLGRIKPKSWEILSMCAASNLTTTIIIVYEVE